MIRSRFSSFLVLSVLLFGASACAKKNTFVAPPPPEVEVAAPTIRTEVVFHEFPGRTQGSQRVEVRARVKGFLDERHFAEGDRVKQGDKLFTIEQRQFQAGVASAEGNLAKAQADVGIAETNLKQREAARAGAVSQIDIESARADLEAARAIELIQKAALDDAKRDLEYTEITAPIEGRASRALVDKGNLVGAADPTLLTTIVKVRPIYFNFDVNERTILGLFREIAEAEENLDAGDSEKIVENLNDKLELELSDGSIFEEKGKFNFVDNTIDEASGTIRIRAEFENEREILADGLFARIRIPRKMENAVIVPMAAIQRDLDGTYVLVVGDDNIVQRRLVETTEFVVDGGSRILQPYDEDTGHGLRAEDRIVVSNLQRARPGIEVAPVDKSAQEGKGEGAGEAGGGGDKGTSPPGGADGEGGDEKAPEEKPKGA